MAYLLNTQLEILRCAHEDGTEGRVAWLTLQGVKTEVEMPISGKGWRVTKNESGRSDHEVVELIIKLTEWID